MIDPVQKLIDVSSEPLAAAPVRSGLELSFPFYGERVAELGGLLERRNGFYAFESALHVFPIESSDRSFGLKDWNRQDLWRGEYEDIPRDILFFAEDVFGCQFSITNNEVARFDPETGEFEPLCQSVSAWAQKVLDDYDFLAGFTFAHDWQNRYGRLPDFKRLMPKTPFVLGGAFELSNFVLIDAVRGMHTRANLARQIRNLPDGAQIKFQVV